MLKKINEAVKLILSKNDITTEEGRRREREKRIALTAITAAIGKVLNTAIPLITVKITLSYLGDELYGLWATVTSFFALFAFADLGMGNGLQTELSRATGKDNKELCRKLISSAYLVLTVASAILVIIFLGVFPFVNWTSLMNAQSEESVALVGSFVMALFLSKLIGIPTSLVQRVQNSYQEGYFANLWGYLGSLLSLSFIIIVWKFDLGKSTMMWTSAFVVVIIYIVNTLYFFGIARKEIRPCIRFVDKKIATMLLKTGFLFFMLSILTSISLSLDNFVVTKVVSLKETASYSIAFKIASFIGIISTMLSTPLWAANGEALTRGDYSWVRKQTKKMTELSLLLSVVASIGLCIVSKPVLFWLGKDIAVSYGTLIGMCVTQILVATTNPMFMVLNASRKVIVQMIMYGIYAVVSMSLKFALGRIYGAVAVAWSGAISFLLIIVPILWYAYRKEVNKE